MSLAPMRETLIRQTRSLAGWTVTLICCACLDVGFAGSLRAGEPDPRPVAPAQIPPSEKAQASQPAPPSPATPEWQTIGSEELTELLTQALQERVGPEAGELEVQLLRPWTPVKAPNQPLSLVLLNFPATGLAPQCILRFELRAGDKPIGAWQTAVQMHLWKEVWVARSTIRRGTPLGEAELARERRDIITLREKPADLDNPGPVELEFCDVVPAGAPVLARALRPRPVVRRGQTAEAVLEDGALRITLRVEVLEEGAPGQTIRVRNPLSRRDLYARVVDAQTVQVSL